MEIVPIKNIGLLLKGAEVAEKTEHSFCFSLHWYGQSSGTPGSGDQEEGLEKSKPHLWIAFIVFFLLNCIFSIKSLSEVMWDSFLLTVYFQTSMTTIPSDYSICFFGSRYQYSCSSVVFLIVTYPVIFNYFCRVKLYHLKFLKDGMREVRVQLLLVSKETIPFFNFRSVTQFLSHRFQTV